MSKLKTNSNRRSLLWALLREMRPHQYTKNLLIFVPLVTAHAYQEASILVLAIIAFICFSFCASGVYFLNDILDIEADRLHASKRNRPLASGDLPISLAVAGSIGFPAVAFSLAWVYLPTGYFVILVIYFLTSNAYSLVIKRISTADVMTLAVLYTLRVVAGAAATAIPLSSWLLAFSVFVFVSLAYLKRYVEVAALPSDAEYAERRGYSAADRESMFTLGVANITASVVVLALYISSEEVAGLYQNSNILWLLCLLMLYWGNRVWLGARRGKINDDPVIFAIKDNVSRIVGVAVLIVVLAARFSKI